MKKLLLLFTFSTFIVGYSQENVQVDATETPSFKRNEARLNAAALIAGVFELSYERVLNEESGAGISLYFAGATADLEGNYVPFSITPYYRIYFGKKPAAGFFFEGFGMYNVTNTYYDKYTYFDFGYSYATRVEGGKVSDFALGFGLGGKWMTRKGVVFELSAGIGRNLFNEKNNTIGTKIVGRGALSVGYRF